MKTYNIAPYFDDFEDFKNYHQILFKPGVAVQARELTQLQSILRGQIEKFGKHIFANGSIVLPGNSYSKMDVDYVRVFQEGNIPIPDKIDIGTVCTGGFHGISAKVLGYESVSVNGVSKNILTISYLSSAIDASTGEQYSTFQPDEPIIFSNIESSNGEVRVKASSSELEIGKCAMAFVNDGVFFVNGSFVSVQKQSVIMNPKTIGDPVTCSVVLEIDERIITAVDDHSLLDPAQGSNNYAAPGADRVRITLNLKSIDTSASSGEFSSNENLVELMRYRNNILLEHNNRPKYSELDKALAKRMYDQAGDYIVSGFDLTVAEALKTQTNDGIYQPDTGFGTQSELDGKVVYRVDPGEGYVNGFEAKMIYRNDLIVNKPRYVTERRKITKSILYGQYVLIRGNGGLGTNAIGAGSTIKFYKGAVHVASAILSTVDYYIGSDWVSSGGDINRVDKLYFSDLVYVGNNGTGDLDKVTKIMGVMNNSQVEVFVGELVCELNLSGVFSANQWVSGGVLTGGAHRIMGYSPTHKSLYTTNLSNGSTSIPLSGSQVSYNGASAAVLNVNLMFSESADSPIIYLGSPGLQSIKKPDGDADISVTSWEQVIFLAGSSVSSPVSPTGVIVGVDDGIFVAFNASGPVPNTVFSLNQSANAVTRTGSTEQVCAYVQVRKTATGTKTKSLQTTTNSKTISGGPTRSVNLNKYDVVELLSVKINGVERRNDFHLTRNTSRFSYKHSYISLRPSLSPLVNGDVVYVQFKYLNHENSASANFFTADSYINIPAAYIEKTDIGSDSVSLRDCLDFRTVDGSAPIVSGSSISTSASYYLGRYDIIVLNKNNGVSVIEGVPARVPTIPQPKEGNYVLHTVYLPPYCYNISDTKQQKVGVNAYPMERIHKLSGRIDKLEEFSMLNFSELQTLQSTIIDASTGLDKFKTGYVVESVQDPFVIADVSASGYQASCSPQLGIYCGLDKENVELNMYIDHNMVDGVSFENKFLTLKYTEEIFASNTLSSSVININPFSIVNYDGSLKLEPNQDMWAETLTLPERTVERNAIAFVDTPIPQAVNATNEAITKVAGSPFATYDIRTSTGAQGKAYSSGPTRLSIDTVMGWESRTKSMPPIAIESQSELEAMKSGLFIKGTSTPQNTSWSGAAGLNGFGVNAVYNKKTGEWSW